MHVSLKEDSLAYSDTIQCLEPGLRGGHGYGNELPSMGAIFIAHGSAFKKGVVIEPFENIHIYNMIARILRLTPAPNEKGNTAASAALSDDPEHLR